jgi:hypothetical protein
MEAEPGELSDVMPGFGPARTAVEMVGAEVLMVAAILQHVVDRGEHGGRDGADRFLRSTFGTQPLELRSVVAVLLSRRRPGALDKDGLQPGRAFVQA